MFETVETMLKKSKELFDCRVKSCLAQEKILNEQVKNHKESVKKYGNLIDFKYGRIGELESVVKYLDNYKYWRTIFKLISELEDDKNISKVEELIIRYKQNIL